MSVLLSDSADANPLAAAPADARHLARGLAYALALRLRLDATLEPRESRLLHTSLQVRPQTPCLICFAHVPERSTVPLVVPFTILRPDEQQPARGIELEIFNPSFTQRVAPDSRATTAAVLASQQDDEASRSRDAACLFVLVFALPLPSPSLSLDPLPLQRRDEEPRPRGLNSRVIVTATPLPTPDPSGHRVRLRIQARQLFWHLHGGPRAANAPNLTPPGASALPSVRDSLMAAVTVRRRCLPEPEHLGWDPRDYTSIETVWCSDPDVYLDCASVVARTGAICLRYAFAPNLSQTLDAKAPDPAPRLPPETVTVILGLATPSKRPGGRADVSFSRSPTTMACHTHRHGLRLHNLETLTLRDGQPARIELPGSYSSDRRHVAIFVPRLPFRADAPVCLWRERHSMVATVVPREPAQLHRGDPLGDIFFLSRTVARPFPTTAPTPHLGRRRPLPFDLDDAAIPPYRRRCGHDEGAGVGESGGEAGEPNGHDGGDSAAPPPSDPEEDSSSPPSSLPPSPEHRGRPATTLGYTIVRLHRDPEAPGALELVPTRLFFALRALPPFQFALRTPDARGAAARGSPKKIARLRYFDIIAR